jgi:hypothetical protein
MMWFEDHCFGSAGGGKIGRSNGVFNLAACVLNSKVH